MKDPGDGLTPGTRLEDFEIERELGAGGFGVTYLALDVQLSRRVAVKEYLPRDWGTRRRDGTVGPRSETDAAQYAWGLERFLKEARSLARFDHPNVVRVHRVFEGGGTAYLVTEYVDGPGGRAWRLSDELQTSGPLTEVRVRALLESLMAGLEPVHASGLVHRDIKPSNVMLRADGSPVLIDFGAARQAMGQQSRSLTSVLTPGYAPIEQYSEKGRQGPWTDVYALGAVAYELLSGRRPDDATQRVLEDALPPLSRVSAHPVGGGLSSAVMAALTVDDRSRPQSLGAWRTLLPRSESEAAGASSPAPSRSVPRADDAGGAGSSAAGGLRRLLDFRRGSSASSAGVGGGAPSGRAPSPASSPTGGVFFGSPAASESAAEAAAVGGSAERRSGFGAAWQAGRWWLCGAGAVAAAGLAVALIVPGRETARRAPADVPTASPSVGARPPGGSGGRPSGRNSGSPAGARTEPDEPALPPAGGSSAASAEAALGLDRATRRRVQAGLAASGVNPGGADGIFGDRTREALAAWQGSRGSPATGYLTRADLSALLAAAPDERERQAAAEAERQRRAAAAEAERQRQAVAAEAERQRRAAAAAEAERQRRAAAAEAERQRQAAAAEAERQRRRQRYVFCQATLYPEGRGFIADDSLYAVSQVFQIDGGDQGEARRAWTRLLHGRWGKSPDIVVCENSRSRRESEAERDELIDRWTEGIERGLEATSRWVGYRVYKNPFSLIEELIFDYP